MKRFVLVTLSLATSAAATFLTILLCEPLLHVAARAPEMASLGAVLWLWLAIAIHELGHAFAGHTQGFVFKFVVVGPLWVERSPVGRYSLRVNLSPLRWGAKTRSYPSEPSHLVRRCAIHLAGGPVASLLLVLGAWGGAAACRAGQVQSSLGLLGMFSFLIFIGAVQPLSFPGAISDGGALLRLARGGAVAARDVSLIALVGSLGLGARPRDWSAELVSRALAPSDDSLYELLGITIAASHATDAGDHARAHELVSRAWTVGEKHPQILRGLAAELTVVAALLADEALARRAFAYANWSAAEEYTKLWAEAEVAALDRLFDASRAKARAGIEALQRTRLVPPSDRDRERLQWLAQRCA